MNKIKLILICFSLILVGCDEDSVPTVSTAPEDCNGIVGGVSVVDCAGVCGGTTTAADCTACSSGTYDCDGTCDGLVAIDCAGVCGGTATEADCTACSSDTYDCEGTCDGSVAIDCAGFCGGTATEADCSILSSLAGTYTPTSATLYEGSAECSGDGMSGICTSDYDVMIEADCPTGVCFDGESTDEESCPQGDWYTGICENDEGDQVGLDEASCEAEDYRWIPMGWLPLISFFSDGEELPSITIMANGTFTDPEGVEGTLVVSDDGTTITASTPARCEESMDLTQSECEGAGYYWSDAEELTIGYDISTGVMTMNMSYDGGCECYDTDCTQITTESDCDEVNGDWEYAECTAITWSK